MEISDTSYIITFISKTYGYNTVIFDPKENTGWGAIEKFIEEYKKHTLNILYTLSEWSVARKSTRPRLHPLSMNYMGLSNENGGAVSQCLGSSIQNTAGLQVCRD